MLVYIMLAQYVILAYSFCQWRNTLMGGPWPNYIKCPKSHFEFTEKFIINKILTKITIRCKTVMKYINKYCFQSKTWFFKL